MATRRSKRGKEAAPPIDLNAGIPKRKKRKRPYNKKVVAKKKKPTKKNINLTIEEQDDAGNSTNKIVARSYTSKPKAEP